VYCFAATTGAAETAADNIKDADMIINIARFTPFHLLLIMLICSLSNVLQ
jgi:ABC-type methionine transport system permease subunit